MATKTNMFKVLTAMEDVRAKAKKDAAFRKTIKADPLATLRKAGVSRAVATNMIANDLGVRVSSDWCVCTGCCCTGCCVTSINLFDRASLPAARNQAAWKALATRG